MSKYERELKRRLQDPKGWPGFEQGDFLERLELVAHRALGQRTVEGSLAAILIFHQLVEEMLKVLIRDGHFLLQVALRPRPIYPAIRRKPMFGQLQQDLRESVEFHGKARLLAVADDINAIRIEVVHKLPSRGSLAGLRREAQRARRLSARAYEIFAKAHNGFRLEFNGYRKDVL